MKTYKKITKEEQIIDIIICNGCGEVVSRTNPIASTYGEIKIVGCYNSTLLSDLRSYLFDLCETCIVKIMDGLKIQPAILNDCGEPEDFDYATDQKQRQDQLVRQTCRDDMHNDAIVSGVCSWEVEGKICGGAPEGMIDGFLTCAKCLVDDEHSMSIISRKDKTGIWHDSMLDQRAFLGLRYLKEVREGKHPEVVGPHDLAIYISTAISMLLTDTLVAAAELHRLTDEWAPGAYLVAEKQWIHSRIPMTFNINDDRAKIANEWLAWAQNAGYKNAAATVMLGNTPEQYWSYYDRS